MKEKQKETVFDPNPNMLKVLEATINPEVEPTVSAWCAQAGVSRAQWYRWQKIAGFMEWFNSEYKKSLEGIRAALVKVGLQKALKGDFPFWKVMMEKTGEYCPKAENKYLVEGRSLGVVILPALKEKGAPAN